MNEVHELECTELEHNGKWSAMGNCKFQQFQVSHAVCILHSPESIRSLMKNRVNKFLSVWNRLRRSLETNGECPVHTRRDWHPVERWHLFIILGRLIFFHFVLCKMEYCLRFSCAYKGSS